jgi:hypothetical protein
MCNVGALRAWRSARDIMYVPLEEDGMAVALLFRPTSYAAPAAGARFFVASC